MTSALVRVLTDDTVAFEFISSGDTATSISHALYNGNDALVNSITATDSGDGHYYALASVTTPGFYASEWKATIGGRPYRRRDIFQAVLMEVD